MKKLVVVTFVLCIITLGVSITALVCTLNKSDDQSKETVSEETVENNDAEDVQYVLYLGTNDKDTNEPVYEPDESKEMLKKILIDHFGGYTIQEATGGWKDGDKVYQEYTLVIYLSDTTQEEVHKAADEMIDTFHQSSVLIHKNGTETEFYSGK